MLNFTCTSNADKQLLPLIRLRVPPEVPILAQLLNAQNLN